MISKIYTVTTVKNIFFISQENIPTITVNSIQRIKYTILIYLLTSYIIKKRNETHFFFFIIHIKQFLFHFVPKYLIII